MKSLNLYLACLSFAGSTVVRTSLSASLSLGTPPFVAPAERDGAAPKNEKTITVSLPPEIKTDASGSAEKPEKPSADDPEQTGPENGKDIHVLIKIFTEEREAILRKQQADKRALSNRLKTVTGLSREELIADFRERHRAWLVEQKALREEMRDRLKTMRQEFKNQERDRLLDDVKETIRDQRIRIGQD